jgi:HAD superfamily hydrolase (TIGR01509 family)
MNPAPALAAGHRRCLLLDWGNTVMRDYPAFTGPMYRWPRVELIPAVAEALTGIRERWRVGLATNAADSREWEIRAALRRAEIETLFDRVYCFHGIGHRKPSPEFFATILADLDIGASEAVMVGDDFESDILGANQAGLRAIWFNERTTENRSGTMYRTMHGFQSLSGLLAGIEAGRGSSTDW